MIFNAFYPVKEAWPRFTPTPGLGYPVHVVIRPVAGILRSPDEPQKIEKP